MGAVIGLCQDGWAGDVRASHKRGKANGQYWKRTTPGPTGHTVALGLWVHMVGEVLRIEVWDNDKTPARKQMLDPSAKSARRLFLVEASSAPWGTHCPNIRGRVLRAEVDSS